MTEAREKQVHPHTQGRSIVMYGNPGTGKTHIAIGLGVKACLEGYSVFFTSVPRLLTLIREAKTEKTLRNLVYNHHHKPAIYSMGGSPQGQGALLGPRRPPLPQILPRQHDRNILSCQGN